MLQRRFAKTVTCSTDLLRAIFAPWKNPNGAYKISTVPQLSAVTTYLVFHLRDKFIVRTVELFREGLGTNKKENVFSTKKSIVILRISNKRYHCNIIYSLDWSMQSKYCKLTFGNPALSSHSWTNLSFISLCMKTNYKSYRLEEWSKYSDEQSFILATRLASFPGAGRRESLGRGWRLAWPTVRCIWHDRKSFLSHLGTLGKLSTKNPKKSCG